MARGPEIHQLVKAALAAVSAALLLQVAPAAAVAGEDSATGLGRSTAPTQGFSDGSTTPIDGFAAGAMASQASSPDGWAYRSTPPISRDGWEVARIELPRPAPVTDGWAYRSTPPISRDGWEVARIELPRPAPVTDGWAFRSDTKGTDLAALDGWAYGTITGGPEPSVQVPTSPAPPRETSPPFTEIALAASLALLVAAGAGFIHHRHQHHLPI